MYSAEYKRKLTTPEKAVEIIANGDMIVHSIALSEPPALLSATAERLRAGDLKKIRVFSCLPQQRSLDTVLAPDLYNSVDLLIHFLSPASRTMEKAGLGSFLPSNFHEIPRMLTENIGVDTALVMVSPMDKFGFFSMGLGNDFTSTAARTAKKLIVEVNPNLPRVYGDNFLHISEIDLIVENESVLQEAPAAPATSVDLAIGRTVAELTPDGATIQLGLGSLPNAAASCLADHKHLGMHTEILGPGLADLIRKGVITGAKKKIHPRKHVFTLAIGDRKMFDFMDDNPSLESYPVSHTNAPSLIARHKNLISVNSILEIDLLGQANAEFLEGSQFSGAGGQLDFVRGAYASKGGKSILAFNSTAKKGTVSRIVPKLKEGTQITTPRMDVHYLVTEYGTVNLKGKSIRDRAEAIIELAHPNFQQELLDAAKEMGLL